jgi:hypothetical protein
MYNTRIKGQELLFECGRVYYYYNSKKHIAKDGIGSFQITEVKNVVVHVKEVTYENCENVEIFPKHFMLFPADAFSWESYDVSVADLLDLILNGELRYET